MDVFCTVLFPHQRTLSVYDHQNSVRFCWFFFVYSNVWKICQKLWLPPHLQIRNFHIYLFHPKHFGERKTIQNFFHSPAKTILNAKLKADITTQSPLAHIDNSRNHKNLIYSLYNILKTFQNCAIWSMCFSYTIILFI